MGYTHYFSTTRKITNEQQSDLDNAIRAIIEVTDVPLGDAHGEGTPEFSSEGVLLNGIGEDSHETFSFPGGTDFSFCKTAFKPYDEVVTAILIAADAICPGAFDISSDGSADDWSNGLDLACRALGRSDLKVPSGL